MPNTWFSQYQATMYFVLILFTAATLFRHSPAAPPEDPPRSRAT
ncbi:hypothetical protein THTE_0896 [Thermogutta terrifontis]|uniref:Uncharacterized protein n=1 Tax=Thermogutta terrifontis TaxID=1331910 RepID=A0A286RC18_9BACT|nr:hypothetical protein THTE_0896 [Thermogutta terrifontis]